jgi:hypothetical protein
MPFIRELPAQGIHEDWAMIRDVREAGMKVQVSEHTAYFVRH